MHRNRHPLPSRSRQGFALLITITLLAFLVLLLVSLASLTRVETQVAANSQQLAQARQNALMAMNIALGQLQKYAGRDQRITARADLTAGVANPYYTGVWDSTVANPSATLPLVWLVSGNETNPTAVTPASIPDPATGNDSEWLLNNSVDAAARVKVRKQPISATGVPGFTGPQPVGNFAYWVGDEGVKAKVSLSDPWENPTDETLAATLPTLTQSQAKAQAEIYRFSGMLRTGVEGVGKNAADDRVGNAYPVAPPYPSLPSTAYQTFKANLPKVLSPGQLAMANPVDSVDLASATKSRFHDLTASSLSVMTNVVDGGLKKDLTAWLSKPDSASNPPRNTDYIADAASYMPRWSQIRSYAGIIADGGPKNPVAQNAEAVPTTPIASALASPVQGIYPVISYARMGYNVSCSGPGQKLAFHLFPVVTLWNPHNVPIAAHDYEMRWDDQDYNNVIAVGKESEAVPDTFTPSHPLQRRATYDKVGTGVSSAFATGFFSYSTVNASGVAVTIPSPIPSQGTGNSTPLRFRLKSPQIEPGHSLVFTLKDPTSGAADEYQVRTNVMEAYSPNQSDNSVVIYGPTMTAADLLPTERYWMGNTGGQEQLSLRDYADPTLVYHWVQNPVGLSRFTSSPINSSFAIQNPSLVTAPLIYIRMGLNQSQGQNASDPLKPATWFATNARWLALFNPLAPHALRLAGGKTNSFSYFMDFQGITNPGPTFGNGNRASIGPGQDVSIPAGDLVIHEFLKSDTPLFSLAQLQHVNLSQMNLYPTYAIGNSLASVYVPRNKTVYTGFPAVTTAGFPTAQPQQLPFRNLKEIHDLSYVLNRALWDKYFFSTVPASLLQTTQFTTDYRLPNSRHVFNWKNGASAPSVAELAELRSTDAAAAHLLIDGGFNINSTSVQAWRALLYSRNGVATDPADATNYKHPYSRYADATAGVSNSTPWQGYRILSDTQIDNLAIKIVEQVKLRGPFVSLADFVNRRLVSAPDATGLKGTLQAAIDAVDADSKIPAADSINARAPFTDRNPTLAANVPDTGISVRVDAVNAIPKPADTDVIRAHWIGDDSDANATKAYTSRAAFAPGYLSQADLLTPLGPLLTPRSDTFIIRTYGDVQNPATLGIEAKAWCEAVVQRLPDYMDTTLPATSTPVAGSTNDKFGRRFRIISFRWLTSSDI
jgi:hypothetical protein